MICYVDGANRIIIDFPKNSQNFVVNAEFKFIVYLMKVQMPLSTMQTDPILVESFEVYQPSFGSKKVAVLDTNVGQGLTFQSYQASEFKHLSLERLNVLVGQKTTLLIDLLVSHHEMADLKDLAMIIRLPESTGSFSNPLCRRRDKRQFMTPCREDQ